VSSILAENKIFPFAIGLMGLATLTLSMLRSRSSRKGRVRQEILFVVTVLIGIALFSQAYDAMAPVARLYPMRVIVDPDFLKDYMAIVQSGPEKYDVGRNYALLHVWQELSSSPAAILFGQGLGSHGVSQEFGTVGTSIRSGDLGLFAGSSLVVILGELGLVGLVIVIGTLAGLVRILWKSIHGNDGCSSLYLRYGLVIFSIMWPIWLWYASAWVYPVVTTLYWASVGYLIRGRARQPWQPASSAQIVKNLWMMIATSVTVGHPDPPRKTG
jgi:hypothetical protein